MAEAAVAIVINKAIAAKALVERGELHSQEHISWIETQMKTLQSYLEDAESKEATWFVNSIRDLALDVEDILDTYLPEIESHKSKGLFGFLKHSSCILCHGITDNDFSLKIEEFKKRAARIEQSKGDIAAKSCDVDREKPEKCDVDREKPKKEFEKKIFGHEKRSEILNEMACELKECRIISIVGPGGIGKTAVASYIYHQVKNKFDCSAMVYISEESTTTDILLDIAKQVGLSESQMKHKMQENLFWLLRDKKYVIFLDDIVREKWDVVKDIVAMTNSMKDSRIIFTCRDSEDCESHKEFNLDFLSYSVGKELFYDSMGETPPPELKEIGDEIVQNCGGWPLTIQVIAGTLKAEESSSWHEVLKRARKSPGFGKDSLNIMLDLSYQELPTKLKPFFLYFGIFPMNREIFVSELIQLWVAEKLVIEAEDSRKPHKIVEGYINKLVERNLIQVYRRKSDGRVQSCGIQNLLHDFCTRKAKEISFFCTGDAHLASVARRVITNSSSSLSGQHDSDDSTVPRKIRALFCFGKGRELAKFIKSHASQLKFLQLLTIDVGQIAINLPPEIVDLSGLIYLKLIGQFIIVPSSIGRMKKLETLEVRSRDVPEVILTMKHLKHLFVSGVKVGKPNIRNREHGLEVDLQNLETLDFDYQYGYHLTCSSFKKLPKLKKLKVYGAEETTLEELSGNKPFLQKLPLLQNLEDLKLQVDLSSEGEIPTLASDFSHYRNLQKLQLFFDSSANITCVLEFPEFPEKLVEITLRGVSMEDQVDPLKKLQELPRLEIVNLQKCKARRMDFSGKNKFLQLQILILRDTKFNEIIVDETGPPQNLRRFIYKQHPQQQPKVPQELKKLMVEMTDADYLA
ncbi:Apoptotic ATPase [Handroanthus impetiginosus]|uniref:Apoptotic ATPase n=1 Tax=Handroanthus impetiginosus TaxID=429701 RepID=A0A2G9HJM9_9LAMI|nr:Apoptotic ATPase [Handroanthus impetiginosus]